MENLPSEDMMEVAKVEAGTLCEMFPGWRDAQAKGEVAIGRVV